MVNGLNGILDGIFSALGAITSAIKNLVNGIAAEYSTLILLGLAVLGGWYLNKRYPNFIAKWALVWFILVVYLLLRYVQ